MRAATRAAVARSDAPPLDLDQIQGNIIGFQKDYQTFLFLRFPENSAWTQKWLRGVVDEVATAAEVLAFNDLFRELRRSRRRENSIKATWVNLAFTHSGLVALNPDTPGLGEFPLVFQ